MFQTAGGMSRQLDGLTPQITEGCDETFDETYRALQGDGETFERLPVVCSSEACVECSE